MSKPFGGTLTMDGSAQDLRTGVGLTVDATVEQNPATVHTLVLRAGTGNDGDVFIGNSLVGSTLDATATWMVLTPGDALGFDLPAGDYVDLRNLFVVGTSSDTVYVFGIQ